MRSVNLEPCWVLHRRNYRETSYLVDFFSARYGRTSAIVRGARKRKHAMSGLLEPFQPLSVSWRGRGELVTVTQLELSGTPYRFTGHVLWTGLYVNELLTRLLGPQEAATDLFASYGEVLHAIDELPQPEAALRVFEKRLLTSIGYALQLDEEAQGGAGICAHRQYRYIAEVGATPISAQSPAAGVTISGEALLALADEQLAEVRVLRECKLLTRYVLRHYLGDKPLISRQLYQSNQG